MPRLDIPAKVSGTYVYVHAVRVPGMLHGRVVRPLGQGAYGDGTVRVRNPGGILEVALGPDDQAATHLAGPVRKVADIDIHPGMLS